MDCSLGTSVCVSAAPVPIDDTLGSHTRVCDSAVPVPTVDTLVCISVCGSAAPVLTVDTLVPSDWQGGSPWVPSLVSPYSPAEEDWRKSAQVAAGPPERRWGSLDHYGSFRD